MPTIHRIDKIKININPSDHNPPHVHVLSPNFVVVLNILTREIIRGKASSKQLAAVRDWMESNEDDLLEKWEIKGGKDNA